MTDQPPAGGAVGKDDRAADLRLTGPVLVYRDGTDHTQFLQLESLHSLTIGRGEGCDLQLPWDAEVSRVHARLDRVGPDWTLLDDGLSRNGTFVNGHRLSGRKRLRDGDTILVGATSIAFRSFGGPRIGASQVTRVARDVITVSELSTSQRQVFAGPVPAVPRWRLLRNTSHQSADRR